MLSLNKLNKLSVKVVDPLVQAVVYEEMELSDEDNLNEDIPVVIEGGVTVECLLNMARKQFAKARAKTNYYACWVDSMSKLIYEAGTTEDEFLKMLA